MIYPHTFSRSDFTTRRYVLGQQHGFGEMHENGEFYNGENSLLQKTIFSLAWAHKIYYDYHNLCLYPRSPWAFQEDVTWTTGVLATNFQTLVLQWYITGCASSTTTCWTLEHGFCVIPFQEVKSRSRGGLVGRFAWPYPPVDVRCSTRITRSPMWTWYGYDVSDLMI